MRKISFFDGAQSATVPVIGNITTTNLISYANDAAYEAANVGSPAGGNIYFNTTSNLIRYYNGSAWINVADVSSVQTFTNKSISGTTNTLTNLDGDNVIVDAIPNLTATNAQTAFAEHQDNIDNLETLSGRPSGSTDLGTFTGTTIPDASDIKEALQALETEVETKEDSANKGQPNGYASLDGSGKVPASQLTVAAMEFQGSWNASTNSPTLADGVGSTGDIYRVGTAGTQDLGSGSVTYAVGDWVFYTGTIWEKADNSEAVISVNGQTGVVVLDTDDIAEGANLYFTNERAQDAVGSILLDTSTVNLTYDDATPTISADVIDDSITNAKLANMATQTIKGRTTAGTGDPEDLSATQATAILNNFVGDSGSGGTKGLVPAPATGDATKFLRGDATWQPVTASGTYSAPNTFENLGVQTSVAANALTIDLKQLDGSTDPTVGSPVKIAFRSATESSGASLIRTISAALSLVIPSGTTIGTTSGAEEYLHLYALDNSGTPELAVSLTRVDTSEVTSTSAISGGSSPGVVYSATARSNVPLTYLGMLRSTQATAGTWATAPAVVCTQDRMRGYRLGSIQEYTASTTWIKPNGCRAVRVRLIGAGGGGGGADGGAGTGAAAGAGGGGGGYSEKFIFFGLNSSETVTIGAGGTGGTASGGGSGSAGGTTSFGAHLSASGGGGGGGDTESAADTRNQTSGGSSGTGSGGDINLNGVRGKVGISFGVNGVAIAGAGGEAPAMGGAGGFEHGGNLAGSAGDFGGGGSGGSTENSTTDRAGGAGGDGLMIIEHYF